MQTVTTIGLDIAKSLFQVHGVDANGGVVIRRQLKRRYVLAFFQKLPSCLIGIEACASSYFWARELGALGHIPRLMPGKQSTHAPVGSTGVMDAARWNGDAGNRGNPSEVGGRGFNTALGGGPGGSRTGSYGALGGA